MACHNNIYMIPEPDHNWMKLIIENHVFIILFILFISAR